MLFVKVVVEVAEVVGDKLFLGDVGGGGRYVPDVLGVVLRLSILVVDLLLQLAERAVADEIADDEDNEGEELPEGDEGGDGGGGEGGVEDGERLAQSAGPSSRLSRRGTRLESTVVGEGEDCQDVLLGD